jgi:hypothetical protein
MADALSVPFLLREDTFELIFLGVSDSTFKFCEVSSIQHSMRRFLEASLM